MEENRIYNKMYEIIKSGYGQPPIICGLYENRTMARNRMIVDFRHHIYDKLTEGLPPLAPGEHYPLPSDHRRFSGEELDRYCAFAGRLCGYISEANHPEQPEPASFSCDVDGFRTELRLDKEKDTAEYYSEDLKAICSWSVRELNVVISPPRKNESYSHVFVDYGEKGNYGYSMFLNPNRHYVRK